MSNEEKQIEEMANITRVWCEIDNSCGSCHWETCNECLAECLVKAGYCKASDVAREIFAEIENSFDKMIDEATGDLSSARLECDLKAIKLLEYHIDVIHMAYRTLTRELKKKYESEDNK